MTDCARALEMLAQFVDHDLNAQQAAWLGAHLEGCAECRTALTGFEAVDSELIAWGQQLGRRDLPENARRQLADAMKPLPASRASLRWIPAAAAAIAAALSLITVVPQRTVMVASRDPARFINIPYLPALDPQENTTVVRMNIRVATLIAVGYRVAADPDTIVPADVLVGEDGRAHAVRVLTDLDWNGTGD